MGSSILEKEVCLPPLPLSHTTAGTLNNLYIHYTSRSHSLAGLKRTLFGLVMGLMKRVPVLNAKVQGALDAEVDKSVAVFFKKKIDVPEINVVPATGMCSREE